MIEVIIGLTLQAEMREGPAIEEDIGFEAIVKIAVGGCCDLNGCRVTIMYLIPKIMVKVPIEMKRKSSKIERRLQ